jgi:hypothetical protein
MAELGDITPLRVENVIVRPIISVSLFEGISADKQPVFIVDDKLFFSDGQALLFNRYTIEDAIFQFIKKFMEIIIPGILLRIYARI